ncbi:EF-hand domain-containing protein [Bdellovibrio sp. KM01]|uniref:EF-hand domain-containing protein n=1 Tax=Bdellovibrio sp. KM01 TaxID=2748865 RepID=UPI0015E98437|nr:EF-hand domain-containing protein [Bdellovibrio sp. KM01]QLY26991.1 EF-hand domain-containing protein [Bdellovibrio sp. KM01]
MKDLNFLIAAVLGLSAPAHADQESVVTVSKDVPMAVNSVSAGESISGAPASGTVTRSGKSTMTVRLINSCFATNLRAVSNPLAKSSLINADIELKVGGVTYKLFAEYPAALVGAGGSGVPASGTVSNFTASKASVEPVGGTVAAFGNIVEFKTKIPTSVTVDNEATITISKDSVSLGKMSFLQSVQDCSTGPVFGDYGWSSKMPTYKCGNFMGKDGDITATFGGFNVAPDRSLVELFISFPGETGFCGGFWSPLMVFFDDKLPKFNTLSDFPLNPGGKVYWPDAKSPGFFLAMDRDRNGKIDQKDELFGDNNSAINGFEALKKLDTNHDGLIDAKDKDFKRLVLWNDKNADGISQSKELTDAGLKLSKISLKYRMSAESLGNAEIRERAKFWYTDAKGKQRSGNIYDIWLAPHIPTQLAESK